MASRPESCAPQARPTHPDPDGRGSCAARTRFIARYGRRISAGFEPDPGVYGGIPVWWGPVHWSDVLVPQLVAGARDRCRAWHVDPDTVRRVARVLARFADRSTGRRCRPTNERLAQLAALSVRQAQRCRGLLKELGLVVEVVRGRSIMTRAERLAAWRRGSSHRQLAGEFALTVPKTVVGRPQAPADPVERVTPPAVPVGEAGNSPDLGFFAGRDRKEEPRSARRPPPRARARPATAAQARAGRLTAAVQRRVAWLAGVSPRRLTVLHRFGAQRWTERDVIAAIGEVLTARGWSVPDRVDRPAAYLACLLRDVDPADRPGALEDAMREQELARRDWLWQTQHGTRECTHGWLAGDLPHPVDGHLACPMCRRELSRTSACRPNSATGRPAADTSPAAAPRLVASPG